MKRRTRQFSCLLTMFSLSLSASCVAGDDFIESSDSLVEGDNAGRAINAPGNPADFDCNTLDTGIYWYGHGNVAQKHVPGVTNPFFDPGKPTVIFAHGWQNNATRDGKRETYNYLANDAKNGVDVDLADAWIDDGWNIGIFYWSQLADENEVKDAEAKIWTADGPQGMRWRRCDDSTTTDGAPGVAVGEIFYAAYLEAMRDYRGNNIRLVGHSLGNQVVTRLAHLTLQGIANGDSAANLLPTRVALLDPFWSKGGKDYLGGSWTGEVARDLIADLIAEGVIFERTKTSNINDLFIGDRNSPLTKMIGETSIIPGYIISFDQPGRHVAASNLYFHSFAFDPPVACIENSCNLTAASAATSDRRTRELMEDASRWLHKSGRGTEDPSDNVFELEQRRFPD